MKKTISCPAPSADTITANPAAAAASPPPVDCTECLLKLQVSTQFDRPAAMRKSNEVNRVLSILDELEREGGNH